MLVVVDEEEAEEEVFSKAEFVVFVASVVVSIKKNVGKRGQRHKQNYGDGIYQIKEKYKGGKKKGGQLQETETCLLGGA